MTKTYNFSLYLFLFLISTTQLIAQSNEGTEFWFGFMEQVEFDNNTKVAMITSKEGTGGTISIPGQNWSETFTVAPNDVTVITLPDFAESKGSEAINNNAIRVLTDKASSVYIHQYRSRRSEATIILPTTALGNSYYAMTYTGIFEQNRHYPAEFLIIATEDDTELTIRLSDESKMGKPAGTTFQVTLDLGETYQVQAAFSTSDLTGSFISSDKDFNLIAGNTWTKVPASCGYRDNLLEQMYPVSTWGKLFVTAPLIGIRYSIFRILAAEDNTTVDVIGPQGTINYALNAGEFVEYQFGSATQIVATGPIIVSQYIPGQSCNGYILGDPAMLILNSVEQTRDTVTLYNSPFEDIMENYINVITRTVDANAILFDGTPLSGQGVIFTPIALSNEFSYATIPVSTGAHTIISDGCGVIATAYGYGFVESYAYSGGASFNNINVNPIPEGGCLGEVILFDTGLSSYRFTLDWDLGDGTTISGDNFTHVYPGLGSYPVQLILYDQCLDQRDTLNQDLIVSLRQAALVNPDLTACIGTDVELGASDVSGARYQWTGPNGFFSEEQYPMLTDLQFADSGAYVVIGNVSGCKTFPATQQIAVKPLPSPNLGPDTLICPSEDLSYILDPGDFNDYQWQDLSRNSTFEAVGEGVFWVRVENEFACVETDTLNLQERCPTRIYVPNVFSPNDDGINDEFRVFAQDVIRFNLRVYNRWGGLLFESNDPEQHWDPWNDGEPLSSGVYTWMIEVEGYKEDGSIYTEVLAGSVTLIR